MKHVCYFRYLTPAVIVSINRNCNLKKCLLYFDTINITELRNANNIRFMSKYFILIRYFYLTKLWKQFNPRQSIKYNEETQYLVVQ